MNGWTCRAWRRRDDRRRTMVGREEGLSGKDGSKRRGREAIEEG